jgi:hypothetical protein
MKDLVGIISEKVYEIVENDINPVQFDGGVNALFHNLQGMTEMLDAMDLIFVRAAFNMNEQGKPCFGTTLVLDEALVLLDAGIVVELVFEDEYEIPYYFRVCCREVW